MAENIGKDNVNKALKGVIGILQGKGISVKIKGSSDIQSALYSTNATPPKFSLGDQLVATKALRKFVDSNADTKKIAYIDIQKGGGIIIHKTQKALAEEAQAAKNKRENEYKADQDRLNTERGFQPLQYPNDDGLHLGSTPDTDTDQGQAAPGTDDTANPEQDPAVASSWDKIMWLQINFIDPSNKNTNDPAVQKAVQKIIDNGGIRVKDLDMKKVNLAFLTSINLNSDEKIDLYEIGISYQSIKDYADRHPGMNMAQAVKIFQECPVFTHVSYAKVDEAAQQIETDWKVDANTSWDSLLGHISDPALKKDLTNAVTVLFKITNFKTKIGENLKDACMVVAMAGYDSWIPAKVSKDDLGYVIGKKYDGGDIMNYLTQGAANKDKSSGGDNALSLIDDIKAGKNLLDNKKKLKANLDKLYAKAKTENTNNSNTKPSLSAIAVMVGKINNRLSEKGSDLLTVPDTFDEIDINKIKVAIGSL